MGIVEPNAEGGFAPDIPVTRAEFAVWLAHALGIRPVHASAFTDVPASSAEGPFIQALYQAGLIHGYGDGTFRGGQPITRAETTALLAGMVGRTDAKRYADVFADVHADDWFADAVGALVNLRVINGKADSSFAPADLLTRGEAVALLYRLLFEEVRIEALEGDTVTINGHDYRYADNLASLFWEANRNALVGSVIQFVNDGDTIVSVTGLDLRGEGADSQEPVIFDGGGGVIDGNLYVSAQYAVITDIHINQNLIITPSSRKALLLHGSVVEGHAVLTPVVDGTNEESFIFLYADAALVKGLLLGRNADVVNLAAEPVLTDMARGARESYTLRSTAKTDKPVTIASLSPAFNAEKYLQMFPEVYNSGLYLADVLQNHVEALGRFEGRAPSPLFKIAPHLEEELRSAFDHFMQHGFFEGEPQMTIADLKTHFMENAGTVPDWMEDGQDGAENDTDPQDAEPASPQNPPATEEPGGSGGIGVNTGVAGVALSKIGLTGDTPALPRVSPPPILSLLSSSKVIPEVPDPQSQRYTLHFVESTVVHISNNTNLDIIVPSNDLSNVAIYGEVEQLDIRIQSQEVGQSTIVIEINGQVGQIDLTGDFSRRNRIYGDGENRFNSNARVSVKRTFNSL